MRGNNLQGANSNADPTNGFMTNIYIGLALQCLSGLVFPSTHTLWDPLEDGTFDPPYLHVYNG